MVKKREFLFIENKDGIEGLNLPNECSIKKGTKFIKIFFEDGDLHPAGATGVVVGSFYNEQKEECYYVIYDNPVKYNGPKVDALIVRMPGWKIAKN